MSSDRSDTLLLEKIQTLEQTILNMQTQLSIMENWHKCQFCNQSTRYFVQNSCVAFAPKYNGCRYKNWSKPMEAYCMNKVFSCQVCDRTCCMNNAHKFHPSALE